MSTLPEDLHEEFSPRQARLIAELEGRIRQLETAAPPRPVLDKPAYRLREAKDVMGISLSQLHVWIKDPEKGLEKITLDGTPYITRRSIEALLSPEPVPEDPAIEDARLEAEAGAQRALDRTEKREAKRVKERQRVA